MIHEIVDAIHGVMPLKEVKLLREANIKREQHTTTEKIQLRFHNRELNYPNKWARIERKLKRGGWTITSLPNGLKLEKGKTIIAELDLEPQKGSNPQVIRGIKLTSSERLIASQDEDNTLHRIRAALLTKWNKGPKSNV